MSQVKRFRVAPIYEIIGIDLLMHANVHDVSLEAFIKKKQQSSQKFNESFTSLEANSRV